MQLCCIHLHVAPLRILDVVLILVAHAHVMPRYVVIRTIGIGVSKQ